MDLKVIEILEINNALASFVRRVELPVATQFKVARILMQIERDAQLIGKQIDKLQAEHGAAPIEGKPGLVNITKDVPVYHKKIAELNATTVKVDLTDRLSIGELGDAKLTTVEMRGLMPFLEEEKPA